MLLMKDTNVELERQTNTALVFLLSNCLQALNIF